MSESEGRWAKEIVDHEAERVYLGWAAVQPDVLDEYPLAPRDFANPRHQIVAEAMQAIRLRGEDLSVLSVATEIEREGNWSSIGEDFGFSQCFGAPNYLPGEAHSRISHLSRIRTLELQCKQAISLCRKRQPEEAMQVLERVTREQQVRTDTVLTAAESMQNALEFYGALHGQRSRLIDPGFKELRATIGGFNPGDLVVIGAQTNVGKSYTALKQAYLQARNGERVGLIMLEDPPELVGSRLIAEFSDASPSQLRRGEVTQDHVAQAIRGIGITEGLPVFIDFRVGAKVQEVVAAMRQLKQDHDISTCYVDYAQALYGLKANSDHSAMKQAVTMLKGAAAALGICLVLLSQVRRGAAEEPTKYDLKEGGDLEIKAEYVVMLWRADIQSGIVRAKIDKSKVGHVGHLFSLVQRENGRVEER